MNLKLWFSVCCFSGINLLLTYIRVWLTILEYDWKNFTFWQTDNVKALVCLGNLLVWEYLQPRCMHSSVIFTYDNDYFNDFLQLFIHNMALGILRFFFNSKKSYLLLLMATFHSLLLSTLTTTLGYFWWFRA